MIICKEGEQQLRTSGIATVKRQVGIPGHSLIFVSPLITNSPTLLAISLIAITLIFQDRRSAEGNPLT